MLSSFDNSVKLFTPKLSFKLRLLEWYKNEAHAQKYSRICLNIHVGDMIYDVMDLLGQHEEHFSLIVRLCEHKIKSVLYVSAMSRESCGRDKPTMSW